MNSGLFRLHERIEVGNKQLSDALVYVLERTAVDPPAPSRAVSG